MKMREMKKYLLFFLIIFLVASCKKKDEDNPVVTMLGDSFMTVILNDDFTDPGANAYDNTDGPLTVEISGTVNPDFAGTYYIVYSATDASGNSGQAIRTVVVRNEAAPYGGEYTGICTTPTDTTTILATVLASTTVNKRIWIAGFAQHQQVSVFADISNDTVSIPSQLSPQGNTGLIHRYAGNGFVSSISDTTLFEIHYSDSVSGTSTTGDMVYKRL
ncbi:MAG TPA: DUF5011 domain-containing protein [Bacteroidales bacterium]|jgi:hypothetical protein|nr:DUF5011 domain-containing protein [Bacteroidales bacterium]HQP15518.1 DUF5011 domain-containing protein [Bacteroidales bacterium]